MSEMMNWHVELSKRFASWCDANRRDAVFVDLMYNLENISHTSWYSGVLMFESALRSVAYAFRSLHGATRGQGPGARGQGSGGQRSEGRGRKA